MRYVIVLRYCNSMLYISVWMKLFADSSNIQQTNCNWIVIYILELIMTHDVAMKHSALSLEICLKYMVKFKTPICKLDFDNTFSFQLFKTDNKNSLNWVDKNLATTNHLVKMLTGRNQIKQKMGHFAVMS